jgi:hypothetical protein
MPPLAAGCELPALCEEATMALQRGGAVNARLAPSLHDGMAQIIGSKQDQDIAAIWGREGPDQLGGHLSGLPERAFQRRTVRLCDVEPDTPGANIMTEEPDGTDILMPPYVGLGGGLSPLGAGVHGRAPLSFRRIIDDQRDRFSRRRV